MYQSIVQAVLQHGIQHADKIAIGFKKETLSFLVTVILRKCSR